MTLSSPQSLIDHYKLLPHPEGGYYSETYRSTESLSQSSLPNRFRGDRSFSTAIYFLIPAGKFSSLHRIQTDEIWHFYFGAPLTIVEIHPDGQSKHTILGQNILKGETVQHMVPHGAWFGAYPQSAEGYSFVGCTVAPGFDFADFELADRKQLLQRFPEAQDDILKLTHE